MGSKIEDAPMPPAAFERLVFCGGGLDGLSAAVNNPGPKNVLACVPSIETTHRNKKNSVGEDFIEAKYRLIRGISSVTKSPWVLVTNNFRAAITQKYRNETDDLRSTHTANMLSAAPFAWSQGIGTLVMGSTYEPLEGKGAWGMDSAHPDMSNAIRFSGVSFAEQDGLYARRTDKVRSIASAPCVKEFKGTGGGKLQFGPAFRTLPSSAASAQSA